MLDDEVGNDYLSHLSGMWKFYEQVLFPIDRLPDYITIHSLRVLLVYYKPGGGYSPFPPTLLKLYPLVACGRPLLLLAHPACVLKPDTSIIYV